MGDLADDLLGNVFWPLLGEGGDDAQGIEDLEARVRVTPPGGWAFGGWKAPLWRCCPVPLTPTLVGPPQKWLESTAHLPLHVGLGHPVRDWHNKEGRESVWAGRGVVPQGDVAQCASPL
jgi:hypothetical protein